MPLVKAFLFDLDGTLVNTHKADYLAYRDAIREVTGTSIVQSDFVRTNGKEMRYKLTELTPGISEDEVLQVGLRKRVHYERYLHLTSPNKPLIDFLQTQTKHQKAILVTSAKRHNATLVLEAHNIARHFSEMVFGDEVANAKPHPEPYLLALKKTGLKPHEVVAFEDSDVGIASAVAAGIQVVKIRIFDGT